MIEIIPAIDLKDGKCVRLVQGDMKRETVYYDDPLDAAYHWVEQGAPRLHLVDLNGAVSGMPCNFEAIRGIVRSVHIPVQLGGGIRGKDQIERYLDVGVDRLILGTLAYSDPLQSQQLARQYPRKLVLGLDANNGFVAVRGWKETTRALATDLVASYALAPIAAVIYTDIQRDGMLAGPNIQATRAILEASPFPVIASGGIRRREDIVELARMESSGLSGAILGKALYCGSLSYFEAVEAAATAG